MNVTGESIVVTGPVVPIATWSAGLDDKAAEAVDRSSVGILPSSPSTPNRPLHRLCEVRRREGLTRHQVARRLGISAREVERQEQSSSDMRLSDLHRWQQALAVPITELLCEPEGELSPPVRLRARLLRVMKTVRSIQQRARQLPLRRLVETLVVQLVEVMPELADAAPWPAVGRRRRKRDLGQAFFRRLSLDPLDELEGPEY
jgi:transcriptional regulator with XRE-family HTH domain